MNIKVQTLDTWEQQQQQQEQLQQEGDIWDKLSPFIPMVGLEDADGPLHQPLNLTLLLTVCALLSSTYSSTTQFAYVRDKGSGSLHRALPSGFKTSDKDPNSLLPSHELIELLVCDIGEGKVCLNLNPGAIIQGDQLKFVVPLPPLGGGSPTGALTRLCGSPTGLPLGSRPTLLLLLLLTGPRLLLLPACYCYQQSQDQ